jgi:hypothetical protein
MNKNNYFRSYTFLVLILIIITILLFINIFRYVNKNIPESFANSENEEDDNLNNLSNNISNINLGINFQSGISSINSKGTINFQNPFLKIPVVFTQIIGSSSTLLNVYSIQIFNITNNGFDYSKNKVYNNIQTKPDSSDSAYIIPKVEESTIEPFIWFAFR